MRLFDSLRRSRSIDGPVGIIIANDFSQSAEKLRNRLRAIADQFVGAGIQKVFLATMVPGGREMIPVVSGGEVFDLGRWDQLQKSFVVVTTDSEFHISDKLVLDCLLTAERTGRAVVTNPNNRLVTGMGLQCNLLTLVPNTAPAFLEGVQMRSDYRQGNVRTYLDEIGIDYDLKEYELDELTAGYRQYYSKHLPRTITIETTNRCNFSCLMCPYHGKRQSAGRRYITDDGVHEMPIERFREIVSEVGGWDDPYFNHLVRTIVPYRRGEPLLYPYFRESVEAIKEVGANCFFATNGSLLTQDTNEFLVDTEVDHIKISVHATNKETYSAITARDLNEVVRNIDNLMALKSKKKKDKPYTGVIFTLQDANKHEVDSYITEWLKRVDYVAVSPENRLDEDVESKKYQDDLLFFEPDVAGRPPCNMIVDYVWIDASLDVIPCIGGFADVLGNLESTSLGSLLKENRFLSNLKKSHALGNYHDHKSCRECQVWYAYDVKKECCGDYECLTSPVMKTYTVARQDN